MKNDNLHILFAKLFIRSLALSGVKRVVISPGSRSTPMVIAALEDENIEVKVIVDERSAGFYALGQSRYDGQPTGLICTSGTAAAHYYPAIIEAYMSGIPLVVITADRPWNQHDAGANQTIDQIKLYGNYVRHFYDLGLPDDSNESIRATSRIAVAAATKSVFPLPGPVHINAHFKKPLEPSNNNGNNSGKSKATLIIENMLTKKPLKVTLPVCSINEKAAVLIAKKIFKYKTGIIVCGPSHCKINRSKLHDSVYQLASITGFPVFSEATSGVRFGKNSNSDLFCNIFEPMLCCKQFLKDFSPQIVLQIEGAPVSKSVYNFFNSGKVFEHFIISSWGWPDPSGTACDLLLGNPVDYLNVISDNLRKLKYQPSVQFKQFVIDAHKQTQIDVQTQLVKKDFVQDCLTEGEIASILPSLLPEKATLLIGNSSPVRFLDTYCTGVTSNFRVLHQRGASGIDGLVSGVIGTGHVSSKPVMLYLGDISMYHDMTGLAAATKNCTPVVIVIVQNNGGRIFEQLPVSSSYKQSDFEKAFVTPQNKNFSDVAKMFNCNYHKVENSTQFKAFVTQALGNNGLTIIEATVPPGLAVVEYRKLLDSVDKRLSKNLLHD